MPSISNAGPAFGAFADRLFENYQKKKQQEHEDAQKKLEFVRGLITSGFNTGAIKDPNQAFEWALGDGGFGGGSKGSKGAGGKKGGLHPILQTIVGAMHKAGQGGQQADDPGAPGQAAPQAQGGGLPQFSTPDEQDQKLRDAETFKTNETIRAKNATAPKVDKATLARAQQLAAAAGEPDNAEAYYQQAAQALGQERQTRQTQYKGEIGQRIEQLVASGIPADRAPAVAALQLQKERTDKIKQASARTEAALAMSRVELAKNTELSSELKQTFPFRLASIQAGADSAADRAVVAEYKAATLGQGDEQKAATAAARIIAAATSRASMLASKKSDILMSLGVEEDEAAIREGLIREYSGGDEPSVVEARAAKATTAPTKPTPKPVSFKKGDKVKSKKDGKVHEIIRVDPNGSYVLGPALP